jgi:intracellular septation protein A
MRLWTYLWRPVIDGHTYELRLEAGFSSWRAVLRIDGANVADDRLNFHREPVRLLRLRWPTPAGELLFEIGPRNWLAFDLRVSRDGALLQQSHPRPFAHLPRLRKMAAADAAADTDKLKRNAPAIITDIALGLLFFVAAKLTDLRSAALIAAGVGIALYGVQWVLDRVLARKVDLLGGLALFGIVMLLVSAGFSWWFDSELAVQLKSTYLGLLVACLFAIDALRGGKYLGQRLSLYLAYNDIDPQRLAWSFAAVGATMALVNAAVALAFSKDTWLWYALWGDLVLAMVLGMWAINRARGSARSPA